MKLYDHKNNDAKWQKKWEEEQIYKTPVKPNGKKSYILDMFPYPSGEGLHVGHPKGYIATDIYSRFKRMNGFDVLHPMGWDAFGLPAEQYAIKNKIHPKVAVEKNVAMFKQQLSHLGLSYDWSREIDTTDPNFYKWTQWCFIKMFEKGLAFESYEPINWCPKCKTGLANEDLEGDTCERCDTVVEKKPIRQWVLKITDYADRLLQDLDTLDWPEGVKLAQKNWIGRSEGAEFDFKVVDGPVESVRIFTTRADTLFGATYVAISAELVQSWLCMNFKMDDNVKSYVLATLEEQKKETDYSAVKEKTGIFSGVYAINPANGEKLPIWIANYVLGGVGTGAIMAVPAHDERDYEFAKKYDLPIRQVVVSCAPDTNNPPQVGFEEVKRNTIIVHLRDKSTGKFALLDWHGTLEGITTAIMGGVEDGQTPEEAVMNEIKEEAGLTGVSIVKKLSWITAAKYCASHKKENRCAHTYTFLAEVDSISNQSIVSEDEQKLHTLVWVSENEILSRLTPDHQKQVWKLLQKEEAISGAGYLVNSNEFDGLDSEEAKAKFIEKFGGKKVVKYKIEDWVFARQRYWGEPFPIVRDKDGKVYAVDESELPVLLPDVESYEPTDTGESPLAIISDWVNVCGYINERGSFMNVKSIIKETKEFYGEGESSVRSNQSIESREVVDVIIRDKDNNFYFLQDSFLGNKFVGGGIEQGETEIEALKREVIEETGFTNFTITKRSTLNIIWTGFHELKGKNFRCEGGCYEVILQDTARIQSEVEMNKHSLFIVPLAKLKDVVFWNNHALFIQEYLQNKFIDIQEFTRETNTMPQWAGSSWYYLRFADPQNNNYLIDKEVEKSWLPVDVYVGGDHATRHLIYARFWHKFLYDIGVVSTFEPFSRLEFLGFILAEDGRKMSKRWGNVINPDDVVAEYGADTLRVYEMFMAPFEQTAAWSTSSIRGSDKFLDRAYALHEKCGDKSTVTTALHQTIKKVTEDIENFKFNTAVSQMMILVNAMEDGEFTRDDYRMFIQVVAPFAPHLTEEVWSKIGETSSVHRSEWPSYNETFLLENDVTIAIQISGKMRGTVVMKRDYSDEEAVEFLKTHEIYRKFVGEAIPKKIIVVKNRLVNVII